MQGQIQIGEHLISPRDGYDHHGIYAGNDEVIHYGGIDKSTDNGEIVQTSIAEFSQGMGWRMESHSLRVFDGYETTLRAYSRLGERDYDVIFNNCECFTTWCIYGIATSRQINSVLIGGLVLLGVVARMLW
jgi:Lecithin retinol acyltransferase